MWGNDFVTHNMLDTTKLIARIQWFASIALKIFFFLTDFSLMNTKIMAPLTRKPKTRLILSQSMAKVKKCGEISGDSALCHAGFSKLELFVDILSTELT